MKAITVKQPWASLIVHGIKDVENRTWKTNFRGRVLIHSGAKSAVDYKRRCLMGFWGIGMTDEMIIKANEYGIEHGCRWDEWLKINSVIIGSVEIVDCVTNYPSIWAERPYMGKIKDDSLIGHHMEPVIIWNWVLAHPILFPKPIPVKGKQSFWDYPNILAEPEEKDGPLFCHCDLRIDEEIQVAGDSTFGYYCRYCGGRWYK